MPRREKNAVVYNFFSKNEKDKIPAAYCVFLAGSTTTATGDRGMAK